VWAGGREFSTGMYQPLVEGLKARGTALHVVAIGARTPPDVQTIEGRNRELLFDRGTTDTGGRRDNILESMATTSALERLAAELLGQYRITFARPDTLVRRRRPRSRCDRRDSQRGASWSRRRGRRQVTMALPRRVVAATFAWSVLAAAASSPASAGGPRTQTSPPAQGATFRSGVDLVALNVTVTDASNRYLTDLGADDFLLFENGVKQEIGYFSRTSLSLSVSLLLDSSASMDDKMRTTQEAASAFVRSLRHRTRRR